MVQMFIVAFFRNVSHLRRSQSILYFPSAYALGQLMSRLRRWVVGHDRSDSIREILAALLRVV